MAKQTINQGTAPTGAGGDTFRSGSAKLQANDDELYSQLGATAQGVLPAALPINKGGTGATTAAAARTSLGLGTAATLNKGIAGTEIPTNADIGVAYGTNSIIEFDDAIHKKDLNDPDYGSYLVSAAKSSLVLNKPSELTTSFLMDIRRGLARYSQSMQSLMNINNGVIYYRFRNNTSSYGSWYKSYSTANTTVDANGFVKAASPIVKVFADKIELNDEAEQQDISFEKLGVGNYLIKGSSGFAQEGWYVETPKDANGNVLVAVVYEQLENGDINVKTYDYMLNNKGRIVADTETPLDIPDGRWIDLRLQELPQPEIEVTDDPEQ